MSNDYAVRAADAVDAAEAALEAAAAAAVSADDDTTMVPRERMAPSMHALLAKARGEVDRAEEARDLKELAWLARHTVTVLEHYGRRHQAAMEALMEQVKVNEEDRKRARAVEDEKDALKEELRGVAKFRKMSDARRLPLD